MPACMPDGDNVNCEDCLTRHDSAEEFRSGITRQARRLRAGWFPRPSPQESFAADVLPAGKAA